MPLPDPPCWLGIVAWLGIIREQAIGAGLAAWMACLRGRYLGRGWRKTTFDAAICALIAWFARDGLALLGIDNQFSYLASIIVGYLGNDYLGALLRRRLEKNQESLMHLSENGRLLIMRLEGGRLRAYQCRAGVWTIGYGHTEGVKPGDKISLDQAIELFNQDVQWAVDAVNALVTVPLSQGQFEALCSFVFNVGRAAFAQSRLLKKLNSGDVVGASAEFPRWDRGGSKSHIIPGLTRRRAEEQAHFLS